jgi:hypothetical protein
MSWFGPERHVEQSIEQAKKIAARLTLPVMARSLTRPELVDKHRNAIGIVVVFLLLFLVGALFFSLDDGWLTNFILLLMLVAVPALFVAGQMRMRRHRDYRDPRIRIEAGRDGLDFTNEAGTQRVDWLSVEAKVRFVIGKGDYARFTGLRLDSPFGPIVLEDDWYRNGRNLAAAIILGKLRAEAGRERDKVGIAATD